MMPKFDEVRDRPAEFWIKLLFGMTSFAVVLLGFMGNRFIAGQDRMTNEISKINGNLQVYESRISRNEADVKELKNFYYNIRNPGEK